MLIIYKTDTEILLGWSLNESALLNTRKELTSNVLLSALSSIVNVSENDVYNKFIHIKLPDKKIDKDELANKIRTIEIILSDVYDADKYPTYLSRELPVGMPIFKSTDKENPIGKIDYKTQLFKDKSGHIYYSPDDIGCHKCIIENNSIIISVWSQLKSDLDIYPLSKTVVGTQYDSIDSLIESI